MPKGKLINVRLDDADAGKVRALQERGVEISAVVRQAVRSEYARRVGSRSPADVVETLKEIYAAHPSEPGPSRDFDVHDRHAFSRAMRRHVRRRARK